MNNRNYSKKCLAFDILEGKAISVLIKVKIMKNIGKYEKKKIEKHSNFCYDFSKKW